MARSGHVDLSRSVFESAGVAIIVTSPTGLITAFNPAAEQMLGYTEAEMVSVATPIVFHDAEELASRTAAMSIEYGEDLSGIDVFVRPLRDQSTITREWTFIHKNGSRIPVMLTVSTLRDEKGKAFGYLGVARDKSQYVKELREAQAASRMANIIRVGQEQFIGGATPQQLFDQLLREILEATTSDYGFIGEVLKDDADQPYLKTHAMTNIAWSDDTRALYESKRSTGFEFRNLRTLFGAVLTTGAPVIANDPLNDPRRGGLPEGHPRLRCFAGIPCFYGGELVGLIGLANREGGYPEDFPSVLSTLAMGTASLIQATRLDARRRASAARLVDQERRLRSILETAADCFIEIGNDGRVKEWNRLAETTLRISRDSAIGLPVDRVLRMHAPTGEAVGLLEATHENQASTPREVVVHLANGDTFSAELVVWDVTTGESTGRCAFLRNIEERKRHEEQQKRLFQSETLLKEVHHRIKNNMQVISSLLSIQSSKLVDEQQRSVFLDCRERIRAMSLVHDRLYSTGNYADIDFADYLREMLSLTVSSNKPDGCEVDILLDVRPLTVGVERAVPLSLIASELVLNSLKHAFGGRGHGRILVRLDRVGEACEFFVGDDGPGPRCGSEGGRGTGLQLVDSLARQIRGCSTLTSYDGLNGVSIRWSEKTS